MNRREMIHTTVLGVAGFGVGTASTAPACPGSKNLSTYVVTVIGALEELTPLLPSQSSNITKAIKIAKDFDEAYRAGKFDSATVLFENLSSTVSQIASDAGVTNSSVKIGIAVAGVAMRAIAVLLKNQVTEDPRVADVVKSRTGVAADRQKSLIESLANDSAVNAIFQAAKP